jgi:hypothetical protein
MWEVEWSAAATEQLRELPDWREAERIAMALHRFAETGEGRIENVPHRAREFRLLLRPFELRCSFEPALRTIRVWALCARG